MVRRRAAGLAGGRLFRLLPSRFELATTLMNPRQWAEAAHYEQRKPAQHEEERIDSGIGAGGGGEEFDHAIMVHQSLVRKSSAVCFALCRKSQKL